MKAIVGQMRRKRGRWLKGMQPLVDLWVGGPGADGRGLDAANGGYDPAPGLQIVSPSGSTPSSSARFLIRDAGGGWRDKRPGVLAGIGGRVWTGDGWTYNGAKEVTFIGPLPALSTHGLTDTVRLYTSGGEISAQDAPGGIVQPYAQRVYAPAGTSPGAYAPIHYGIVNSLDAGSRVFWHVLIEVISPLDKHYTMFGVHNGDTSEFVGGGPGVSPTLNQQGDFDDGNYFFKIAHRGIGPNGGQLVEVYCLFVSPASVSGTLRLLAYPFAILDDTIPHEIVIHHAAGHQYNGASGELRDWPTVLLCAAGIQAALVGEQIILGNVSDVCSLLMRVDWLIKRDPLPYVGGTFASFDGWNAVFFATDDDLRWFPPDIRAPDVLARDLMTVGLLVDDDRKIGLAVNGQIVLPPSQQAANVLGQALQIGRIDANTYDLGRLRRILIWPRVLTPHELAAVQRVIVGGESV